MRSTNVSRRTDSTRGFSVMPAPDPPSQPGQSSPPSSASSSGLGVRKKTLKAGQVLVVTSVMFTFISYWRTAAIVLCDLASTAYYIGGIVESQIGKAAPWFILAVMMFSYGVRGGDIKDGGVVGG